MDVEAVRVLSQEERVSLASALAGIAERQTQTITRLEKRIAELDAKHGKSGARRARSDARCVSRQEHR